MTVDLRFFDNNRTPIDDFGGGGVPGRTTTPFPVDSASSFGGVGGSANLLASLFGSGQDNQNDLGELFRTLLFLQGQKQGGPDALFSLFSGIQL